MLSRKSRWRKPAVLPAVVLAGAGLLVALQQPMEQVWIFDRLAEIGGLKTTVLGNPKVIDTPLGKAVEFDGDGDAIFFEVHPLAGAAAFTWEVIFRPDSGGRPEQRFFHFQERDPKTGNDTNTRLLFETRLTGGSWYLDSFALSGQASRALMNRERLHPLDAWYHAAMVYDGKEFSNYVNGELEGKAPIQLAPQGPGRASAGVRINLRDYFKGAIRMARMTRRALTPAEFLKVR
jgi:hypothetical protein